MLLKVIGFEFLHIKKHFIRISGSKIRRYWRKQIIELPQNVIEQIKQRIRLWYQGEEKRKNFTF